MPPRHAFVRNAKIEQQVYAVTQTQLDLVAAGELIPCPGHIWVQADVSPPVTYVAANDQRLYEVNSGLPLPENQTSLGYIDFRFTAPTTVEATTGMNVLQDTLKGLHWTVPGAGWTNTIKIMDPPPAWARASALTHDWVVFFESPHVAMIGFGDRAFDVNSGGTHFYTSGGAKLYFNGTTNSNIWYGLNNLGANAIGFMTPTASWSANKFFKISYTVGPGSPGLGAVSIYQVNPVDWDDHLVTLVNAAAVPNVGGNHPNCVPVIVPNRSSTGELYLAGQRVA